MVRPHAGYPPGRGRAPAPRLARGAALARADRPGRGGTAGARAGDRPCDCWAARAFRRDRPGPGRGRRGPVDRQDRGRARRRSATGRPGTRIRAQARAPGGEWVAEVQARMARATGRLIREGAGTGVLIVSHGESIRRPWPGGWAWAIDRMDSLHVDPGSVSLLTITERGAELRAAQREAGVMAAHSKTSWRKRSSATGSKRSAPGFTTSTSRACAPRPTISSATIRASNAAAFADALPRDLGGRYRARHRLQRRLLQPRDEAARRRRACSGSTPTTATWPRPASPPRCSTRTSSSASSPSTTWRRWASGSTSSCSWACSTICAIRCWRWT